MRVLWTGLGILGLAVLLTSCGKTEAPVYQTPVPKPCIIPTNLPNNAMGKLGIQVIQIGKNVRIVIPSDNIFKDSRYTELDPKAYPALDDLASLLKKYPNRRMIVTGYTDEMGTYRRDAALSEHQAQSLITYLWTQGVPHECLIPIGMGKDDSGTVSSNRSIDGKADNRRIEITFRA
ncbi:MAG TPA: OmpA family protein [Gammaproteobacteria bacterium]|nr:OmpA family protein [Gammaproteobacteria bacterium]